MTESGLLSGGEPSDRGAAGGGRGRKRLVLLGCLLLVAGAALPLLRQCTAPRAPAAPWVFAVCDVGQGDALFLAVGPHAAVAVDTGPDPAREDACAGRLGITEVPLVVLTHFHADHVDGLSGLLHGRTVRQIETTTVDDPPAGAAQVARLAAAAGIPVTRVAPDERRSIGPVSWQVLWPQAGGLPGSPEAAAGGAMAGSGTAVSGTAVSGTGGGGMGGGMAEDGPDENPGPNNDSIVMAVTVAVPGAPTAPFRLLLTGDIETPVQQILLGDRREYLRADVLKVPHHGSAKQDPDFLAAVRPSMSVISVGRGNPYGHPAPRTVYLAGSDGARVYRTDLDGMVLVGDPSAPDGPIPVAADRGDGTVPTAPPSPTGAARPRHGGSGHHPRPPRERDPAEPAQPAS
jgi:competence protein ComEC